MIDGDVNNFIDILHYGEDLCIIFDDKKYFFQGWDKNGLHYFVVTQEKPYVEGYFYEIVNADRNECVRKFLDAPLWNGKKFFEVEKSMKWIPS